MLDPSPNTVLRLVQFKERHQAKHKLHTPGHVIACSVLQHDVLATSWLQIAPTQHNEYQCALYAAWGKSITAWETDEPMLIWQGMLTQEHLSPVDGLRVLAARFDRIVLEKDAVYLRDRALIDDPRHLPYIQYWIKFTLDPATHCWRGFFAIKNTDSFQVGAKNTFNIATTRRP